MDLKFDITPENNPKLAELLNMFASSEEKVDAMYAIINEPDSESADDMSEAYLTALGYDPTTYFDIKTIERGLDLICEDTRLPETDRTIIRENTDRLVQLAISHSLKLRESQLFEILGFTIVEELGINMPDELINQSADMFSQLFPNLESRILFDDVDDDETVDEDDEEILDDENEDDDGTLDD